ncbi:MAG: DAK2 domain fusion protein YloV [Myxococcota bacterium]|jgi:DAK2 domain fusion protein YloV
MADRGGKAVGSPVRLSAGLDAIQTLLSARRNELNALNVFPVPDGDTGTNMLGTIRATRAAIDAVGPGQRDEGAAAVAAADGALRGARGNSGVLLSQVLRALLADDVPGRTDWLRPGVASRLTQADQLAHAAVATPVAGTILTVVQASAAAAVGLEGEAALAAATAAAHVAVAATPSQNEVLARAGVVDAGGRGFALVLEALLACARGVAPTPPPVDVPVGGVPARGCGPVGGRYEVMFLLHPTARDTTGGNDTVNAMADATRTALTAHGDSVVVVAAADVATVHVHTDDIGWALEVGLLAGRPSQVRVEDLRVDALVAAGLTAHPAGAARVPATPTEHVALVVGTQGSGLGRVVTEHGGFAVPLTRGHLPSVAELLDAVAATGAARVVLLPGHRDVRPAAAQAAELAAADGVDVTVVAEAYDPARVLAALAVSQPNAPDSRVLSEAAAAVRSGEVIQAARVADTDAGPVIAGSWLAVVDGRVVAVAATPADALVALVAALGDAELASLFVGAGVDAGTVAAGSAAIIAALGGAVELDVIAAGQRPAAFVLGLE